MKNAIVIGASSGIGRALAKILSEKGYRVGLAARRLELLHELQAELKTPSFVRQIDVTETIEAIAQLQALIKEMGHVDLFIVNAGVMFNNQDFDWLKELQTIQTNVIGFAAMAHTAMSYLIKQSQGHLVGISSISALRGESDSPSYSASKAFDSNFLDGLRMKAHKGAVDVTVTDIQPGWVDTAMAAGETTFWMASPEEAAYQIYAAIEQKRPHAYITARWRLIAWLVKLLPDWAYRKVF